LASKKLTVLKFGGTSMGNRDAVQRVMSILIAQARKGPVLTVVSAMSGVTDSLLSLGHAALERGDHVIEETLTRLEEMHVAAFGPLVRSEESRKWMAEFIRRQLLEAGRLAHGIALLGEFTPGTSDKLLSFGEILSSNLLARALADRDSRFCHFDARDAVVVEMTREGPVVDHGETEARARAKIAPLLGRGKSPVVPGFICRTTDGRPATLGRNGSDYSASILGAALSATEIWIYTDVDGIMTADPNLVAEARVLPRISYQEAAEMSYFGAKVVHPKTMIPAVVHQIPIRIKNTFSPRAVGTLIGSRSGRQPLIKTVTSVRDLALLNIEGNGMVGIPGVASRVFEVLARENINIMMISQSSSEHSICLVVRSADADTARTALEREFGVELDRHLIERVAVTRAVAIVSIIGAGMRGTPGIAGKFFEALRRGRINVLAIAQGSSELNISAAIAEADYRHAVQAIHSAFGLTRDLNIFVFGCGNIGRTLLGQICSSRKQVNKILKVRLKVLGVCNTRNLIFDSRGLSDAVLQSLASGAAPSEVATCQARPSNEAILDQISRAFKSDVVLVDATATDFSGAHLEGLRRGFHCVTANKRPLAGSLEDYRKIQELCQQRGLSYRYEATFGAGLPLLSTLQDLIETGDRVLQIQGCLSGTLGFICTRMDEGVPFSAAIREAVSLGYTEPDPRDDLSGTDVARKALIIAREIGLPLEMRQVSLAPMLAASQLRGGSVAGFLEKVPRVDASMAARVRQAKSRGEVLRYVVDIDSRGCRVGLRRLPRESPIGRLAGPDNILVFRTERYNDYPLVIQGPGAGAGVTAAGVLGDILKVAKRS
jgi:bifunctional aspartokinase / homoserine dehydrogenase 1